MCVYTKYACMNTCKYVYEYMYVYALMYENFNCKMCHLLKKPNYGWDTRFVARFLCWPIIVWFVSTYLCKIT